MNERIENYIQEFKEKEIIKRREEKAELAIVIQSCLDEAGYCYKPGMGTLRNNIYELVAAKLNINNGLHFKRKVRDLMREMGYMPVSRCNKNLFRNLYCINDLDLEKCWWNKAKARKYGIRHLIMLLNENMASRSDLAQKKNL